MLPLILISGSSVGSEFGRNAKDIMLYDWANWSDVKTGEQVTEVKKHRASGHDFLVEKGWVGREGGFEPSFTLGAFRLRQTGGVIHGRAGKGKRLRSGIVADSEEGRKRGEIILSGRKMKVGSFRDMNVSLSGEATLHLANHDELLLSSSLGRVDKMKMSPKLFRILE